MTTRLIDYVYHRPGKPTVTYSERLVADEKDVKILMMDQHEGAGIEVDSRIILEAGAPIIWFVFPDAWYDIGRFHLTDGTFTGWYTNLCKPVEIDGSVWTGTDLFIDHWLSTAGESVWLDKEEFDEAIATGVVDPATEARVVEEQRRIQGRIAASDWPDKIAHDFDLQQAISLTSP